MGIRRLPAVMVSVMKGVLGVMKVARDDDDENYRMVPKGHIAVYLVPGAENIEMSTTHDERDDERQILMMMKKKRTKKKKIKRLVVPIRVLNHPCFQGLLKRAEDEFGFNHPMGVLTIPCPQQLFLRLT